MDSIYISIAEAAGLEGVEYHTFYRKAQRNNKEYKLKREPNQNGGKEKILVSIDSLSRKAKRAYKAKIKAETKKNDDKSKEEIPWYVYVDYNWYVTNYSKEFYKGVETSRYVKEYLDFPVQNEKTKFAGKLAKKIGMSQRSFLAKVASYIEGQAWAVKEREETGQNHDYIKILALCRKPREKNTFPSLSDEAKSYIENLAYDEDFNKNNESIMNLYEELIDIAEERDFEVPSYDTVWRYVNMIYDEDGEGAKNLVAKGVRYWKNRYMTKRKRNTGALKVLEVLQGDVHSFDCWVRVKRSNGKWQAIRPCLVGWVDTRSRCLVGWQIAESPDAQIIKKSLINAFYPKSNKKLPYGVSKYLLIDNGKEYTAKTLTGRPRKVRFTFDSEAKGFYRSLGIEDDMRSLPYQPWSKAQVERFFRTVCEKFTKKMKSYTGTLTGSKTDAKVEKNIKKMLENEELLTIEEFAQRFEKWVVEKFHTRKHYGLKEQGENDPRPISVFNNAEKYIKAPPPLEYALSLLMKSEERRVTNMGIKVTIGGQTVYYHHDKLHKYKNKKVDFRYHPNDISKIFVYSKEGKKICEAVSYELLRIAPKVSEAGFIEHNKHQKRELRNERERIRRRTMTYEERQREEEVLLENAGKKTAAPELSGKKNKAVTLPEDQQYRDEVKEKSKNKKSKKLRNEYFDKQADKALMKLRKLG